MAFAAGESFIGNSSALPVEPVQAFATGWEERA
jgi:hypothetical protein